MKRDGNNISLWQNEQAFISSRTGESSGQIFDVIVVGGGVTGVTTAYELLKQGKKCLLIEARNLCFGTTGGTTAHLNNFFDTTYAEVASDFGKSGAQNLGRAALDALELYSKNIRELNIDCQYRQSDGIVYARNEKEAGELEEMFKAAFDAGIPVSYTNNIPIQDVFFKALVFGNQAQIHPVKYVYALARAFENAGGVIMENCRLTDLSQKDPLEVETSRGLLKCTKLVYATHIPPGVNLLHLRCAPYRSYAMGIELEDDQYPKSMTYDMTDPYHYYRTQETEGGKILIAGGEDHKTGHEEDTELRFKNLEEYLSAIFRIREIKYKWSSQYFEPADGLAYIGHLPGASENVFVATGFGGNGMTYSHIAARVLAAKIASDRDEYEGLFKPGRLKPVAGFTSFVKENADVVNSLVTDRFKIPRTDSITDMPNDTGHTVNFNHQNIAVYKNPEGELFCLNPTCPHLKCTVKWNQTERSWDCPCHGARYSTDGEVLTGPSTRSLEKVRLEQEA